MTARPAAVALSAPAEDWEVFNDLSALVMAQWLLEQARLVPLKRYAKARPRKTAPKPVAKRVHDPRKPHQVACQKGG